MVGKEMDLMSRKKVTLIYASRYRKASSKEESQILDEFIRLTGYNRCYASWLLRNAGRKIYLRTRSGQRVVIVADPERKIKSSVDSFFITGKNFSNFTSSASLSLKALCCNNCVYLNEINTSFY